MQWKKGDSDLCQISVPLVGYIISLSSKMHEFSPIHASLIHVLSMLEHTHRFCHLFFKFTKMHPRLPRLSEIIHPSVRIGKRVERSIADIPWSWQRIQTPYFVRLMGQLTMAPHAMSIDPEIVVDYTTIMFPRIATTQGKHSDFVYNFFFFFLCITFQFPKDSANWLSYVIIPGNTKNRSWERWCCRLSLKYQKCPLSVCKHGRTIYKWFFFFPTTGISTTATTANHSKCSATTALWVQWSRALLGDETFRADRESGKLFSSRRTDKRWRTLTFAWNTTCE